MKRIIVSLVLIFLCCVPALGQSGSWKGIEVGKTTEADVRFLFGPPTSVKLEYTDSEFQTVKNLHAADQFRAYILCYTSFYGDLNILHGPLGSATSVELNIEKGIVYSLTWDYAGLKRRPAEIAWEKDKTIKTSYGPMVRIGKKTFRDGIMMFVTGSTYGTGKLDGPIQVFLSVGPESP